MAWYQKGYLISDDRGWNKEGCEKANVPKIRKWKANWDGNSGPVGKKRRLSRVLGRHFGAIMKEQRAREQFRRRKI